jgi:predicted RNase H-like HicB family nuclease
MPFSFAAFFVMMTKEIEATLGASMNFTIETEQETDGRWIAEVTELPGVHTYGDTRAEAVQLCEALALRVVADGLENGEPIPEMSNVFTVVP